MGVIDEVKQRTDIAEIVGQHVHLTKAGRTLRGLCPFHSEKHPSFFVYPEQQSWHCFGCNTGGDVFSFIMKKQGIDFGDTLRLLAQMSGVALSQRFGQDAGRDEKERLYQVNEAATRYFHDLLLNSPDAKKARDYVASRGLSSKTVVDFQLGFGANKWEGLKQHLTDMGYSEKELLEAGLIVEAEGKTHDRFRNKLLFPIHDLKGRTVGFGSRVLDDSLPKYINSPQTPVFDKSSSLYGINLAAAAIRQQDTAVIVEGYMDVITAHQSGFNNVVASMGTSVTEKQISTLKRLTRNIAIALDADAAGEEATMRNIGYENMFDVEMKFVILPKGKDPDDVITENTQTWQDLVAKALPVVDYTFNRDEALVVDRLLPIVAEIENDLRRDRYLTKLEKLTGIRYDKLEAATKALRAGQKAKKPMAEAVARAVQPIRSSPLEEYCLALLLQHPELKAQSEGLLPEYFENSENREIFIAWQQANDLSSLKDKLDPAIWEHLDLLITKNLPPNQIEQKYADCGLNLRKKHLQNLAARTAEALASEAERGGTAAELAKLEEQGIEVSMQLGELFTQRRRTQLSSKGGEK